MSEHELRHIKAWTIGVLLWVSAATAVIVGGLPG